jgi:hypothetical protein
MEPECCPDVRYSAEEAVGRSVDLIVRGDYAILLAQADFAS